MDNADIRAARKKEFARRARIARIWAKAELAKRHKEEMSQLYQEMKVKVNEQSGPIPGDDDPEFLATRPKVSKTAAKLIAKNAQRNAENAEITEDDIEAWRQRRAAAGITGVVLETEMRRQVIEFKLGHADNE
jgi:hypothetical protein